jgi:uncharacterized protein with LGFP repeats
MQARYTQLGSQGSVLGATVRAAQPVKGGRTQRFTDGRMYWSRTTGAHYLRQRILAKYAKLGQTRSPLGFPTSDSHPVNGGYGATFQQGGIYQVAGGAAYVMTKRVHAAWLASGGPDGPAGLPIGDQRAVRTPAGQTVRTQRGSVFRGAGLAAVALWGPVNDHYFRLGNCNGVLGYPLTSPAETTDRDGQPCTVATFQHGTIVARAGGVAGVWGPVDQQWRDLGGVRSVLGVPVADPVAVSPALVRAQFAHGYVDLDPRTSAVTVVTT